MTQTGKVLRHLEQTGSITPLEALEKYGCMRLGARIWDLKRMGYPIKREIVTGKNRCGETVKYARYSMEGRK